MFRKSKTVQSITIGGFIIASSLGCDVRGTGEIVTEQMLYDGFNRTYIVYSPSNSHSGMPLVFNLHGYGSNAVQQMEYSNMNVVADTAAFIVVYPNAVGNRWNSGISDSPPWPTPMSDDVGFMDALIDTMHKHHDIDINRVYVCGMSNGGFMSLKLACELSHRIRAVASVTGVISESTALDCEPQRTVPIFHIHGTDDRTVPFDGTFGWYSVKATANHWADLYGCVPSDTTDLADRNPSDGCTVTRIAYADSLGNENIILYSVAGGGHTWPGSAFDLPGLGITNRDINASEEIWNFFVSHDPNIRREAPA